MNTRIPGLLASLCFLLLLASCSNVNAPAGGTLRVNLADGPGDFDAVNIVIESVAVHAAGADSGSGWREVLSAPGTYDLLQLRNGVSVVLVDRQLPPGDYTQMRLVLGDGCNVVVGGVTHPLTVPSGAQSGLKLNHPFTISNDGIYDVTLDFDAGRSIHMTGGGRYMLRPVIRAMAAMISGSLHGVVLPVEARATVTAASVTDTLTALADTLTGAFCIPVIREGTYNLSFAPTAGAFRDTTLVGVPVVRLQDTVVDTMRLSL
jgi:hypothetical protein